MTDVPALLARVRQGLAAGWTSQRIAEDLNATGYCTPRGKALTAANVRQLRKRVEPQGVNARRRRKKKR